MAAQVQRIASSDPSSHRSLSDLTTRTKLADTALHQTDADLLYLDSVAANYTDAFSPSTWAALS